MAYKKINWENSPSTQTPISAENLRHMDEGIADAHNQSMYTNNVPTVSALGGISVGTTFDNMPVTTLLTKLLYPYVAPVVSASSSPNGGTYEKGVSVNVTKITVSVTKKSEDITKVEVFDGSTPLGSKTDGSTGSLAFTVNRAVTSNKSFTAKVTDKSNNTIQASTGLFNFVYPYYFGVIDVPTPTETIVKNLSKIIEAKGNKSKQFSPNNQFMVFAYPEVYGNLKRILDPNSFEVLSTWKKYVLPIVGLDGTSQPYNVYVSKQVTVSDYKMTFQY